MVRSISIHINVTYMNNDFWWDIKDGTYIVPAWSITPTKIYSIAQLNTIKQVETYSIQSRNKDMPKPSNYLQKLERKTTRNKSITFAWSSFEWGPIFIGQFVKCPSELCSGLKLHFQHPHSFHLPHSWVKWLPQSQSEMNGQVTLTHSRSQHQQQLRLVSP